MKKKAVRVRGILRGKKKAEDERGAMRKKQKISRLPLVHECKINLCVCVCVSRRVYNL